MVNWSHIQNGKQVHMVDVSTKPATLRVAWAEGKVNMHPNTLQQLQTHGSPKGPILETARIAAIQAAKKTSELVPLCHPLPLDQVDVAFEWLPDGIRVESRVTTIARTGVEMEALTAVTIACLTIYDMCKSVDRSLTFGNIRLMKKTGGRSGTVEITTPKLLPLE